MVLLFRPECIEYITKYINEKMTMWNTLHGVNNILLVFDGFSYLPILRYTQQFFTRFAQQIEYI